MRGIRRTAIQSLLSLALLPAPAVEAQSFCASGAADIGHCGRGVAGDFDGDGTPDVLWQDVERGELEVWLMHGTTPHARVSITGSAESQLAAAGTDDFNNDGRTDILFRDPETARLVLWYMAGTEPIGISEFEAAIDMAPVSIYDFDGDRSPDILFQDNAGQLQVIIVRDSQVVDKVALDLGPTVAASVAEHEKWLVEGTADFDGDGDNDLLLYRAEVGNPDPGPVSGAEIAVALMEGTRGIVQAVATQPDRNWEIGAVQDYDLDGDPDLIWENDFTGETAAWVMDRLRVSRSVLITDIHRIRPAFDIAGPR